MLLASQAEEVWWRALRPGLACPSEVGQRDRMCWAAQRPVRAFDVRGAQCRTQEKLSAGREAMDASHEALGRRPSAGASRAST
jgi:hypothetical protein